MSKDIKIFPAKDVVRLQPYLAQRLEATNPQPSFRWQGFNWCVSMEGGRVIHPEHPHQWYSPNCVEVTEDGTLCLSIKHEPREVKYWDGRVFNPQIGVGTVRTQETFGLGTFSAELQLPKGKRLWPAFWLTGSESWPPEIDICEAWSNDNGSYFRFTIPQFPWIVPSWKVTTNVHYKGEDTPKMAIGSRNIPICKLMKSPDDNFITYKVERHTDFIKFYVNDRLLRVVDYDVCKYVADKPMRVVFDLWTEDLNFKYDAPMLIREFKYEPLSAI